MKKKYRPKLKMKLLIITSAVSMAAVALVGLVTIYFNSTQLVAEVTRSFADQSKQFNNNIDNLISTCEKQALALSLSPEAMKFFEEGLQNTSESYINQKNLVRKMYETKIGAFGSEVHLFYNTQLQMITTDVNAASIYYTKADAENSEWYNNVMQSKGISLINNFTPFYETEREAFAVAVRADRLAAKQNSGFVVYSISKEYFEQMLYDTSFYESPYYDIFIVDNNNGTVFSTNKTQFSDIQRAELAQGIKDTSLKDYLVEKSTSDKTGWSIICTAPKEYIFRNIYRTNFLNIIVVAAGVIIIIIGIYIATNKTLNPIIQLKTLMLTAEEKQYSVRADIKGNDEIAELGLCFNEMADRVLTNQVLRREAEINALLSQINPHFLYNTLGNVKTLIRLGRTDEAITMVEKLGSLFRLSVNVTNVKYVPLESELEHARAYLAIMSIRYDNSFKWEISCEEALLQTKVLSFVVQPLCENALTHGIMNCLEAGEIKINCFSKDGDIYITVSDNGEGIDADKLLVLEQHICDTILPESSPFTGIALRNVHRRARMSYGFGYGITVESKKGSGTKVIVKMGAPN